MNLQQRLDNAIAYTQMLLQTEGRAGLKEAYLEKILQLLKDIKVGEVKERKHKTAT